MFIIFLLIFDYWSGNVAKRRETLKYGTFGCKKFGFRAMSQRILKLCVASLLNILCFPVRLCHIMTVTRVTQDDIHRIFHSLSLYILYQGSRNRIHGWIVFLSVPGYCFSSTCYFWLSWLYDPVCSRIVVNYPQKNSGTHNIIYIILKTPGYNLIQTMN